jgi:hypothetical protein
MKVWISHIYYFWKFLHFFIKIGHSLKTSMEIFNLFLSESHLLCKFRFLTQLKGQNSHFCTVKHRTLVAHVAQWYRIWMTC